MEPHETVVRRSGSAAGGGMLVVYEISRDAFGVLGMSAVEGMSRALTKKDRRKAFNAVASLIKHYNVTQPKERILFISLGCDSLGNPNLVVTATTVEEMML